MEIVRCDIHGTTCLLKTGVREGPNKGKSFYICAAHQEKPCNFTHPAEIPPSHCLHHEEFVVELQALLKSVDKSHRYRLYFRCALGKKEGQKWCGSVPWDQTDSEKRNPLMDKHLQPSCVPPVRNPFKAPGKIDQTSEWRKLHETDGKNKKADDRSRGQENGNMVREKGENDERIRKKEEGDGGRKEAADRVAEEGEKSEKKKTCSSGEEPWRSKPLPTGMKIKKRVSGEEKEKKKDGKNTEEVKRGDDVRNKLATRVAEEGEKSEKKKTWSSEEEPWRSKPLPTGMKIKKRVSGEEREKDEKKTEEVGSGDHEKKEKNSTERKQSVEAVTSSQKDTTREKTAFHQPAASSTPNSGLNTDFKIAQAPEKVQTSDSNIESPTFAHSTVNTDKSKPHQSDSNSSIGSGGSKSEGDKGIHFARHNTAGTFGTSSGKNIVTLPPTDIRRQDVSKVPRDQPQRRSPVELLDDDDADDDSAIATSSDDEDEDDDVQIVSVQASQKHSPTLPAAPVQKTLTSYPGFQPASQLKGLEKDKDPKALHSLLSAQLKQKKATLSMVNVSALPDKGGRLKSQVKELEEALESLNLAPQSDTDPLDESKKEKEEEKMGTAPLSSLSNPFSRPGGTILLPDAPPPHQAHQSASSLGLSLSQGFTPLFGADSGSHAFYGGRMTESRLIAIRHATTETIDHLHKSLETCPGPTAQAKDPRGIKVELLPHQRGALAWLLWREDQKPCGGILADDMGLGKTLTVIALILAQRKSKDEKDAEKEEWISKTDSSVVASEGTLVICPASLVHHWKKEVERHVKGGRLSVYLYHGPNRQRNAKQLASYDVVVTTYSLVSKEIPVKKEEAERPSADAEPGASSVSPLLSVAWARVVLDEAHNIKNPKVQTSMAVCKLRARARWAVTGTPIQNNLLDMYSLLKFLRCSPFDEYKLWKAQVDNGSRRGGERLNILTQALLLRRTKDQLDASGKPLVALPDRTCELHRLKLSQDEQSVYDVVFAQSRSTLQSYLRRHEGKEDLKEDRGGNPFDRVANEFGMSQKDTPSRSSSQQSQASSAVHILSLLLRLRQCCCHLSLLKKTLDQSELQGDGITLSLEEQLNALSLSSESTDDNANLKDTVSLNGSRFQSEIFEETRSSTKLSAVLSALKEIRSKEQKSVIVSQWTSMLRIVAVHLKNMGLRFGVIDGTVNIKHRMDLVEEFNTNPRGPQVMLVSLCAGGVGLNLVGGNHLFLMDMHWNPALEDQACDRIYRVGQHRDVTIHKFICEGTVEDKISSLQERKKDLALKVLTGTSSTFTKLSLADLRLIFGV